MKTLLLLWTFCLISSAEAQQASRPAVETMLDCQVLQRRLSNLERVPLTVTLNSSPIDIDRMPVNPSALPAKGTPFLKIIVTQVTAGQPKEVETKLIMSGGGRDLKNSHLNIDLEIPLDATERHQKVSRYVDHLQAEGKTGKEDPRLIGLLNNPNVKKSLISTYENSYLQNRVGSFEIGCQLFPNGDSSLNKAIRAPSVRAVIENRGDFLDQSRFHHRP